MRKGYVTTSILLSGVGMLGAVFAWTYSQLSSVNAHASESDQRIAKLEEAVITIKSDTTEIKTDIKQILKNTK